MYPLIKRLLSKQLVKFLLVGGTTTALQFILLVLMVELLMVPKVIASATSYAGAAVYNYCLNYTVTFASRQSHWETLPKFVVVVAIGLSVNTSVFALCLLLMPYVFAQCIAVGAALVTNFVLHKFWIYRV